MKVERPPVAAPTSAPAPEKQKPAKWVVQMQRGVATLAGAAALTNPSDTAQLRRFSNDTTTGPFAASVADAKLAKVCTARETPQVEGVDAVAIRCPVTSRQR